MADDPRAINHARWQELAALHGLEVLHIQCVRDAAAAGFRVDALLEHLATTFDDGGGRGTRETDGRYRLRVAAQQLPLLFTLRATRPG